MSVAGRGVSKGLLSEGGWCGGFEEGGGTLDC